MKKIYRVPVFQVDSSELNSCKLSLIDNIIVFKSRFGYKELFTDYYIKCINDTSDILLSDDKPYVFIFKCDLNEDNVMNSDQIIEYSSYAPSSKWKIFYDKFIRKDKNMYEGKKLKRIFSDLSGSLK